MRDYYTLLGVDRHASEEALRHAYRNKIMALHPDHNPGDAQACARVREVIEAYHVLSDIWRKREYDLGMGYCPAHIVAQPIRHEPFSFQWVPRLALILVFFAVLAGIIYGGSVAFGNRTVVFRPQLDVITFSADPASPSIMGRPIPRSNMNVAREDPVLASNSVCSVCLQTALYADGDSGSAVRFFAELAPASL